MTKAVVALFTFFLSFLTAQGALSAVKVTDVSVNRSDKGVRVDITFDQPVSAKGLRPVFERNFVQFALKSTKMDAARIVPVTESEVQKIFAYPYSPDTSRLRIILKRDHQWAKGRVSLWNANAKTVRVFVKDPQHAGENTGVSAVQKPDTPAASKPPAKKTAAPVATDEEKKLLSEVLKNTKEIDIHDPESLKAALDGPEKKADRDKTTDGNEAVGTKTDPSRHFIRMALALFAILGLFLGGVLLLRKYSNKLKKLPFGKKERLIQVVATHYLGNKKSISLVKITGEYMVVGVSNEGISLISKLGPEVNVDKYLEDRFWGGTFEKHLDTYAKDARVTKEVDLGALEGPEVEGTRAALIDPMRYDGPHDVKAVEKKTVESVELSPIRASIKEKLTKLKPLA